MRKFRGICIRAGRPVLAGIVGTLLFAGCATRDENEVSTIPWNRPQSWEGGGALGGFSTDYLNQ